MLIYTWKSKWFAGLGSLPHADWFPYRSERFFKFRHGPETGRYFSLVLGVPAALRPEA